MNLQKLKKYAKMQSVYAAVMWVCYVGVVGAVCENTKELTGGIVFVTGCVAVVLPIAIIGCYFIGD